MLLLLTGMIWWKEQKNAALSDGGQLLRPESGEVEYEAELMLVIDGTEETEMIITVPAKRLTAEEETELLKCAIEEIREDFQGQNTSLEEVRNAVVVREDYQGGKVFAEWEFSKSRLIAENGTIAESEMEEESETVGAKVYLTCEDSSIIYEFYFTVYKHEKNAEELFYEKLNQLISENGQREGEKFLWLPAELEGHTLVWKNKQPALPLQIFVMGIVVLMLLPALEKEREKEMRKRRETSLLRSYPGMVNKLMLLLGAGMTLRTAWKHIVEKYIESVQKGHREKAIVYEEMLITQREIESGKSEIMAYESFGERCDLQKYRKLTGYLIQNTRKGNRALCELLEREVSETFDERKRMAQQLSEEVGTKLLFPMLLMLGIVIAVIMVPAVISFQLN